MVQSKRPQKSLQEFMKEDRERFERNSPVLKTRWFVLEIRPAYNTGGYYDQDVPEERRVVSPYFESKSAAVKWMNDHEPDEGKHLKISYENLRKYCYEKWGR